MLIAVFGELLCEIFMRRIRTEVRLRPHSIRTGVQEESVCGLQTAVDTAGHALVEGCVDTGREPITSGRLARVRGSEVERPRTCPQ